MKQKTKPMKQHPAILFSKYGKRINITCILLIVHQNTKMKNKNHTNMKKKKKERVKIRKGHLRPKNDITLYFVAFSIIRSIHFLQQVSVHTHKHINKQIFFLIGQILFFVCISLNMRQFLFGYKIKYENLYFVRIN